MDMIGHQHVGVNPATIFFSALARAFKVKKVVRVRKEGRLAIIPPLDKVLRHSPQIDSRSS